MEVPADLRFQKCAVLHRFALTNAKKGNLDHGFAFAGANVYRVNKLVSVQELIDELMEGYKLAVRRQTAVANT